MAWPTHQLRSTGMYWLVLMTDVFLQHGVICRLCDIFVGITNGTGALHHDQNMAVLDASLTCLGHVLSTNGVCMEEQKVHVVMDCP